MKTTPPTAAAPATPAATRYGTAPIPFESLTELWFAAGTEVAGGPADDD
jgi:hypothetical protein